MKRYRTSLAAFLALGISLPASPAVAAQAATLDGVTFASKPNSIFVPLLEISQIFEISLAVQDGRIYFGNKELSDDGPILPEGRRLIPLQLLPNWGVSVEWRANEGRALLSFDGKEAYVRRGDKRVVVDKSEQELRAVQGGRIVMRSRISTGKVGKRTPNGNFEAGPYKARMHRSTLYDDAPMPWSVQITGDIFVHGYSSVPGVPASHGCIRLPIDGANPARFFYDWVDIGTPVEVEGRWRR